jgi:hypothetical protein
MAANAIWEAAIEEAALKAGWHLARTDLRGGFLHDILATEAFAFDLTRQIKELARQLRTETFTPTHCIPIAYPKGRLGTRPGTHLALWDRVILWSVVAKIAPVFDKELDKGVYSYRLKERPKKGELFKETDILDIPFLKKSFISKVIDPFEAWYTAWPEFAEASAKARTITIICPLLTSRHTLKTLAIRCSRTVFFFTYLRSLG